MRAVRIPPSFSRLFCGIWGARAASLQLPAACGQRSATFATDYVFRNSLGKLPTLTGWQPVLPRKSHARLRFQGSARVSRVGFGVSLNSCELVGQDSVEPRRIGGSADRRPSVQSAGTMGLVSQRHVHPVNRPTWYPPDETVLLFRSIPSSNSTDRKSHAPPWAKSAKTKSR